MYDNEHQHTVHRIAITYILVCDFKRTLFKCSSRTIFHSYNLVFPSPISSYRRFIRKVCFLAVLYVLHGLSTTIQQNSRKMCKNFCYSGYLYGAGKIIVFHSKWWMFACELCLCMFSVYTLHRRDSEVHFRRHRVIYSGKFAKILFGKLCINIRKLFGTKIAFIN